MTAVTREAIQWYVLEQSCYIYEMYEHDDSETARIEEETLEGILGGLAEHYGVTEENLAGCRAVAEGVSDIIDLYAKAPDDMENAYAGLKEQTEKTRDAFGEYQQKFEGRSGELTEYIRKCCNMVSQCSYSDISMTEYDAAYTDIPGVETLEGAREKLITDTGYTDEEIQKVSEKKEEIVTAYIRRKEGEAKIRKLGGIIIGGLSLLCLPALSFTMPQLIVSCSMSSICVVYNTDQYLQGLQLMDATETRNTDAKIEKMVDFHNETLNRGYDFIGNISTAYSGTLCMGTLIYGLGGGNVTFLSVTENTWEDLLTDYIAGNIDKALGGGNPLRSMVISSLLSGGISATKGKITGGGGKGTFDVIDAADVRKAVGNIDMPDVRTAVKDIDVPDVKTAVKDIDVPDAKTAVKDIDVPDVKTTVKDIDVSDVKTVTNVKEPIAGTQQGNIQSKIKTDTRKAIDVKNQSVVSGKGIESGSKTVNGYDTKLNVGQQNKHIPGTNEYANALNNGQIKSIMYGDASDIQNLLNDKAGTGEFLGTNKERVNFGRVIGQYVDPNTGVGVETTIGIIHYGKNGTHIVPARPN